MQTLRFSTRQEENAFLSEQVRQQFAGRPIRVLEAGCGRGWGLDLEGIDAHITGVDLDEESVRIRRETVGDLDEYVVGDLRTVDLEGRFDVVYSSFVLEHIAGAEKVLDRFVEWLNPGGLLLLRIPDRDSVYGFATRHTPFWVHLTYKRYVRRKATTGLPGYGPFPTVYDPVVSRKGIRQFCRSRGLVLRADCSSNVYLSRLGPLRPVVSTAVKATELASFGKLSADHNNLIFVIQKREEGAPPG